MIWCLVLLWCLPAMLLVVVSARWKGVFCHLPVVVSLIWFGSYKTLPQPTKLSNICAYPCLIECKYAYSSTTNTSCMDSNEKKVKTGMKCNTPTYSSFSSSSAQSSLSSVSSFSSSKTIFSPGTENTRVEY